MRNQVIGRKNYYGCGSLWSAEFTARVFTVLQTIILWGLNPRLWLSWYLGECAKAYGKAPEDTSKFLPWNLSPEKRIELKEDTCKISQSNLSHGGFS